MSGSLDRIESGITEILNELESLRQRVAALEEQNAEQQAQILALFQRFPPPQSYADYKTINDLTPIEGGSISDDYKYAFASPTQDFSLALSELKANIKADFDAVYAAINGSQSQAFEVADPEGATFALSRQFADNRYPRRTQDSTINAIYDFTLSPIVPNATADNEAMAYGQPFLRMCGFRTGDEPIGEITDTFNMPAGWTISKIASGKYRATHNLGWIVSAVITIRWSGSANSRTAQVGTTTTEYFNIDIYSSLGETGNGSYCYMIIDERDIGAS